jgi:DNA polymerase III gamma/tau subunit
VTSLTDKYRPQRLEEVLGQDHILKSLESVLRDGRAKAFIFAGPSGCGKTTLARIISNRVTGGMANITNITERDGAFASGADMVRDLVSSLIYKAIGDSPAKAVIMDECHKLSNTAWNVLLKPIEEPPEHVYWMLCTTEPDKIPKTIKTRCVSYGLHLVKEEVLLSHIVGVADAEGFTTPDEVLESIAGEAGGSPRLALNLLEACHTFRTASEVLRYRSKAGEEKEVIDLCRFLANNRGSWADAMRLVAALEGLDVEGIRIQIILYLAAVARNTKSDTQAVEILRKIEAFSEPYVTSDKQAPLLISIGVALGLGQ